MDFSNIKKYYSQIAVTVVNTLLLFILLNIGASFWSSSSPKAKNEKLVPDQFITYPRHYIKEIHDPENLLRKVYAGHTEDEIRYILQNQAPIVDHPTLGIMNKPGRYGEYHSGKEGVRYDSYVSPANIDSLLNGTTWLLGGSTAYGFCMAQEETISHYLNQLDPDNTYLNFGVPTYHQNTEIKKLIILLKKGYRPKKVLFLDGSNDLFAHLYTNFHPAETPQRIGMAFPLKNRQGAQQQPNAKQFIKQLPLIALMEQKRNPILPPQGAWKKLDLPYENLDDSTSLYFYQDDNYFKAVRALPCSEMEFYPDKLWDLYKMNQALVDQLAIAYGFEYEFIFQPLGFLHPENPFIKDFDAFRDDYPCLELLETTQQTIRDSIQAGALTHFRDLSQADDKCASCYVDLVHYSGSFNQQLAKLILAPQ